MSNNKLNTALFLTLPNQKVAPKGTGDPYSIKIFDFNGDLAWQPMKDLISGQVWNRIFTGTLTATRTYRWPDMSGTVALVGPGVVSSFGAADFAPLFNTTVTNPDTTPFLDFIAIPQSPNLGYYSPNGITGIPAFRKMVYADMPLSGVVAGTYKNVTITVNAQGIITSISQSQNSPTMWFSEYQVRSTVDNTEKLLYVDTLPALTITTDGSYLQADYQIQPENNANAKSVRINISGIDVLTYSLPINTSDNIYITITIKAVNNKMKTAKWITEINRTGQPPILAVGSGTIDFSILQRLELFATGVAAGDVSGVGGEGVVYSLAAF